MPKRTETCARRFDVKFDVPSFSACIPLVFQPLESSFDVRVLDPTVLDGGVRSSAHHPTWQYRDIQRRHDGYSDAASASAGIAATPPGQKPLIVTDAGKPYSVKKFGVTFSAWTNEKTKGLLRQYFSRGTDLGVRLRMVSMADASE